MESKHEVAMRQALALAKEAYKAGEVPVGAVITRGGEIIAEGRNKREAGHNALLHAEIEAINGACNLLGNWRLSDCELYVTLEPCPMCAGAIINARLKTVIYGAADSKAGACGTVINLFDFPFNHRPAIISGVLGEDCAVLLSDFFKELRRRRQLK